MHSVLERLLTDYDRAGSLGSRLRARRIKPLLDLIADCGRNCHAVSILDVGGTASYWRVVPEEYLERHSVTITIVNLPGSVTSSNAGRFRFVEGDGCDLPFPDASFDIAHSNSVLEHVGDWSRMKTFAREFRRIAPRHFLQTPNYWFPIEPHAVAPFIHWLPVPWRLWIHMHFKVGHYWKAGSVDDGMRTVEDARLLTRSMLSELMPGDEIIPERFLGLTKSLVALHRGRVDAEANEPAARPPLGPR